jgi:ribose-phosphate pyrophosphokinase
MNDGRPSADRDKLRVYAGSANPRLSAAVAERLGLPLGGRQLRRHPDGEIHVQLDESVRGTDCYVIQSTGPPVNEHIMELLVFLDALRRGSAGWITAIIPYYGYARQEKKSTGREPITARLIADLLTAAGANRVVSLDLHAPAIQGFFNIGMDHLTAVPILAEYLLSRQYPDGVVVAPDLGRVKLADRFASALGLPLAIIHKRRLSDVRTQASAVVGEVEGRTPIVVDDMISTGGTVLEAVRALVERGARPAVTVVATHGLFVGPAVEWLRHPAITEIVVTDTLELPPERRPERLRVLSVADLLAQAIERLHHQQSISALFPPKYGQQPV